SSTVTSCPSRASISPDASPHTPPPDTTILVILSSAPVAPLTGVAAQLRATAAHVGRKSTSRPWRRRNARCLSTLRFGAVSSPNRSIDGSSWKTLVMLDRDCHPGPRDAPVGKQLKETIDE